MRRAFVVLAGLALVACLALPAWAQEEAATNPVTIVLWTHLGPGPESSLLDAQIAAFNNGQQGVEVQRVDVQGSYVEALEQAAATGELPDIVDLPAAYLANYAWRGMLAPLDEYVDQAMRDDFLGAVLAQNTWDGKLYALPSCESSAALWANKDYLDKTLARIPQGVEDAWTAEEFEDVLKRLANMSELNEAMELHLDAEPTEFLAFAYHPLLLMFGGSLFNADAMSATGAFNSEQSVAALTEFQLWFAKGYADAALAGDSFARGESGLSWNGQWAWQEYDRALGGKLLLLPLPMLGESAVSGMGGWSWAVSAQSENKAAAWAFLDNILATDQMLQTATVSGAIPARKSAADHSALYGENGPLRLFVQQLAATAQPRPRVPASPVLAEIFARTLLDIALGHDVQSELDAAAAEIDRELMRLGYMELPAAEETGDTGETQQ